MTVIPGRDEVASPESIATIVSTDPKIRNCASEASAFGASQDDVHCMWRYFAMISGTLLAGGVLRLRWVRTMPSMMDMPTPGRTPSCTLSKMF